jgi:hypothetical protein
MRLIATTVASMGEAKRGGFWASVSGDSVLMCCACKGNQAIFQAGNQLSSPARGHDFLPGLLIPTVEAETFSCDGMVCLLGEPPALLQS